MLKLTWPDRAEMTELSWPKYTWAVMADELVPASRWHKPAPRSLKPRIPGLRRSGRGGRGMVGAVHRDRAEGVADGGAGPAACCLRRGQLGLQRLEVLCPAGEPGVGSAVRRHGGAVADRDAAQAGTCSCHSTTGSARTILVGAGLNWTVWRLDAIDDGMASWNCAPSAFPLLLAVIVSVSTEPFAPPRVQCRTMRSPSGYCCGVKAYDAAVTVWVVVAAAG